MRSILGSRKGFVWYELLLVIVLVSVFASLVVPRFLEVKEKENAGKVEQALEIIYKRQESYLEESGRYGLYDDLRIGDTVYIENAVEKAIFLILNLKTPRSTPTAADSAFFLLNTPKLASAPGCCGGVFRR